MSFLFHPKANLIIILIWAVKASFLRDRAVIRDPNAAHSHQRLAAGKQRIIKEDVLEQDDSLSSAMIDILKGKLGDRMEEYAFPPPIFAAMEGRFLELDLDAGLLTARFPVRESYLNPYGTMQGGMVAAAVDNTLGPLSMLIAPPNVTRRLEMTYSQPVTLEMEYIVVSARLLERQGRWLFFKADVRSREGLRLARSKAVHWIMDERQLLN